MNKEIQGLDYCILCGCYLAEGQGMVCPFCMENVRDATVLLTKLREQGKGEDEEK